VFHSKLEDAPGAFDFNRRLQVLDFIGIDRALVFPGSLAMNQIGFLSAQMRSGFAARLRGR